MTLWRWISCGAALVLLSGCGDTDVKETLGLTRKAPDEFRVVARPPLSVPPEFNLRPPREDEEMQSTASASAMQAIRGDAPASADTAVSAVGASELPSTADASLLNRLGADKVNPDIRDQLRKERKTLKNKDDSRYFWSPTSDGDTVVDADKESARIKQNKAENKPVTAGETPSQKPQDKGFLGNLF